MRKVFEWLLFDITFLMLFFVIFVGNKMVFSLRKIYLSEEEKIPLDCYNAQWRAKIGTLDVML